MVVRQPAARAEGLEVAVLQVSPTCLAQWSAVRMGEQEMQKSRCGYNKPLLDFATRVPG
jgi:hypothetical protein